MSLFNIFFRISRKVPKFDHILKTIYKCDIQKKPKSGGLCLVIMLWAL